ncbi:PHB depolymerase family esterase [Stachybotrys elegans]|uniref:Carboxylic ester hydrolase n=1 Tax=Stachybotrys elegans TaxID=80388 RepID=A0A8K0SH37_9HYPO|nr:PHB depolymerase family esterase [Stachybotrys elegans]
MRLTSAFAAVSLLLSGADAALQQISNWGTNPGGLTLHAYIPNNVASRPAVILALHPCGGSGPGYAQSTRYGQLAEQYGFLVLFPSSVQDSNCWDVATTRTLTRNGGGHSQGLNTMVNWAKTTYNADASRVFVTGTSSGCMMTNVMMATYPDTFAAATCYSGVSAGCLAGSPGSSPGSANPTCANGNNIKSAEQWAAQARAMYPGYTGAYPRLMTYHGLSDTFVHWRNLGEQLKQWSAVQGVSFSRNVTNTPRAGYTQMIYGDGTKLIGITAQGVGHVVPAVEDQDLQWFGITGGDPPSSWEVWLAVVQFRFMISILSGK